MQRRIDPGWWLLAAVLALRLFSMAFVPLADTSEPRYAEIARLMAVTGDWITPWFEPGKPFWGKPPLAFWMQALSFRLFGVDEFAARLPSWLATLGMLALVVRVGKAYGGARTARWAALITATCVLAYVASGAVLTDPFLALGTTLCMTAFYLAAQTRGSLWGYGFFLGLAIGLLAKGPLALVLVAGPIVPWLLWQGSTREHLAALPWFGGTLLTAALVVPWYVLAELKTPGFLDYFIVGEHIRRYLDPGWAGDLYGTAHLRPYGSIWGYWLMATFPWGPLGLGLLAYRLRSRLARRDMARTLRNPLATYLLAWALFTLVFFTVARNVLWTYVLPAIPAFALLLAGHLDRAWANRGGRWAGWTTSAAVPLVALGLTALVCMQPGHLKTERDLVGVARATARQGEPLFYLDSRPFSARYYSRGSAGLVSMSALRDMLQQHPQGLHLAVPKDKVPAIQVLLGPHPRLRFENQGYSLFDIPAAPPATALAADHLPTAPPFR